MRSASLVPRVSVLIPTFNHASFVRETIASALSQDYGNFHIVVSDDGSADGTPEVVQAHFGEEPRVRLIRSVRNEGLAANFNRLLDAIDGDYYAWLGGDDVMLPGKLARQVAQLESRPDSVGSVHDAEVFLSETGQTLGRFSEMYNGRRGVREGGVELWFDPLYLMLPSTMMVRADARPERPYDERLGFANEFVFDVETFRSGQCVGLPDVLVRYRRHAGNVTGSAEMRGRILEDSLMALSVIQARHPNLTSHIRKRRAGLLLAAALAAREDRRLCLEYARSALTDGGLRHVIASAAGYCRLEIARRLLRASRPI